MAMSLNMPALNLSVKSCIIILSWGISVVCINNKVGKGSQQHVCICCMVWVYALHYYMPTQCSSHSHFTSPDDEISPSIDPPV
jgi:hypothetical protein